MVAVRAGALSEVGGEAAWWAEPSDATGFGRALAEAVSPSPEREVRLAKGRSLAGRWNWDRSAAVLQRLWAQVAEESAR